MSDPFVAEIRIFPFNFAPRGWTLCSGQLLPISQYTAIFSLVGTLYGGDGRTNFGLPNLQGRVPMHQGQGPGLTNREVGEEGGVAAVSLQMGEMPVHNHTMQASASDPAESNDPTNNAMSRSKNGNTYTDDASRPTQMNLQALASTGTSTPHNNMQPYLTLNFCIAMQGVFPPRG